MFDSIEDVENMTVEDVVRRGIEKRRDQSIASIAEDERGEAEFLDKMKLMPASDVVELYMYLKLQSAIGNTVAQMACNYLASIFRQIHEQIIREENE